jgi:hypothetical protein
MSERYWITGAQLGLFIVQSRKPRRERIVNEIIDKQFICNAWTDKEKLEFENRMNEFILKSSGNEKPKTKWVNKNRDGLRMEVEVEDKSRQKKPKGKELVA